MFPQIFHALRSLRRRGFLIALSTCAATSLLAHEDRLIDLSAEPPRVSSPDWVETTKAPQSAASTSAGPVVPAARQPVGALSGRIVFTNGGHGWVYDPSAWRLQRGIWNEMNEDYGNLDQLNLFATQCFNAGAVVVPLRPLGQQTNEVVLDNDDPEVTYAGGWADSASTIFYGAAGDVGYRFASLAATETATATYTPNLPATGYYPVYTWVRHGADRGSQLYRIRHTGGEAQVRIPHHMVGNGWVYLGEYYFNAGANAATGAVLVSNLRGSSQGSVVIADAIRFGNGMGSIARGGLVSGYPREDEGTRYWIQASLGQGQPASLYDGGGADESDGWSGPPKMSAEINREASGGFFKRIHISFHSNGGGGRGALGLITSTPTDNQSTLAQLCGREVNEDLLALGSPPLEVPWTTRTTHTFTGGYSEIDGSLFNYEMDATILEVAFHDNLDDARLMRDPKARTAVAKGTLHAVIKYMNQFDAGPLQFPPETPASLRARGAVDGSIALAWTPPVSTGGSGAPTGYVIYRSADGYGFGDPVFVGNVLRHTVSGLTAGVDHYFRVAAINAGGESLPSEVVGCRTLLTSDAPRVLFVNGFDRCDRTSNLRQNVTARNYGAPDATGAIERVWPRRVNAFDYVVAYGKALSAAGMAFDTCGNEAVAGGQMALTEYPIVFWSCGQESTADETFSTTEQNRVMEFRAGGGHLFVSGSEIAWDLGRTSGPTALDRVFLQQQLKAALASDAHDNAQTSSIASAPAGIFASRASTTFDDGSRGIYWVQSPDVLTPTGTGVAPALLYPGNSSGVAALTYDGSAGGGKVVYFGFPFETITSVPRRAQYVADILDFFGKPEVLVAVGAPWKYDDRGLDLGTAWTASGYDDAAWPQGPAQLGFGEGDEATLVTNDPTRITTYFRKTFQVPDARAFRALTLRLLRDDGAVVWLNGAEILRSNMPATGAIAARTPASASVSGADENVFLTFPLNARELRTGTNVLAVEIHQSSTASSDLSFDLELSAARDFASTLIAGGSIWKYRDNNLPPPGSWTTPAFDDSAWASGPARLGYGGDGEVTVVSYGPDFLNRYRTTWFRQVFSLSDPASFDALRVDLQRDDGAVVFLNGVELLRDNLPAGPLTQNTLATLSIGGTDETTWQSYIVPASALRAGANVLAVELHQASANSSDLGFDLRLSGLAQGRRTFADWQKTTFGSDRDQPVASAGADIDQDGAANLLEFALGSDATAIGFTTPVLAMEATSQAFRFVRDALATDLTLTIQAANELTGPWTDLALSTAGDAFTPLVPGIMLSESVGGALRTVEFREPIAGAASATPQRFLRLKITR